MKVVKPNKWAIMGIATLAALLALQLIAPAHAGPAVSGWD